MACEIRAQLEEPALGAEQHFLGDGRGGDAALGIADEFFEQLGLGQQRFAEHVARREPVHCIGNRNERQRRNLVCDRGEVGGLLRVASEQDGVAGPQQGIDVVVPGHDVERMLGNDARRDLQHETADFLADRHVM